MSRIECSICPHHCALNENEIGFCNARSNKDGEVTAINYGKLTSMALDPIEKKPLYHFHPNSVILSVGSFGCNFRCPFCQNHEISMADSVTSVSYDYDPDKLVALALSLRQRGNIGIAYTYNEPLVGYEYVRDCAQKAKENGLFNVVVTNGYICEEPLVKLLPLIDAMNIDLKAFTEEFYHKLHGDLKTVLRTIELAAKSCHVEVTTLIIPGENDSEEEIWNLSRWVASIRTDIPLHLSRFFPRYQMMDKKSTEVEKIQRLAGIARESLQYVHLGNC